MATALKKKTTKSYKFIANYSCHHQTFGEERPRYWGPTPGTKAGQQEVAH